MRRRYIYIYIYIYIYYHWTKLKCMILIYYYSFKRRVHQSIGSMESCRLCCNQCCCFLSTGFGIMLLIIGVFLLATEINKGNRSQSITVIIAGSILLVIALLLFTLGNYLRLQIHKIYLRAVTEESTTEMQSSNGFHVSQLVKLGCIEI